MIPKRVDLNIPSSSSFSRLVSYITSDLDRIDRVGDVFISNCISEDVDMAVSEVEVTQAKNTKSTVDKTYHLLLSFPAGEKPNTKTLQALEKEICKSLGLAEHQRITVVHNDTDNTHMHIAINKVHPKTHNVITPHNDFHKMAIACEKLEKRFGLAIDNHTPTGKSRSDNKISDMERQTGQEAFVSFVKRECLGILNSATTWNELHEGLAVFGVSVKLRGNGLVFACENTTAKASTVGREFTKSKLEKRFGAFRSADTPLPLPEKHYTAAPIGLSEKKKDPLYLEFEEAKQTHNQMKQSELRKLDAEYAAKRAILEDAYAKARREIKNIPTRIVRTANFDATRKGHRKRVHDLLLEIREKRSQVYNSHRKLNWIEWLQKQASQGSEDAVRMLRKRAYRLASKGSGISGESIIDSSTDKKIPISHVTKQGTVIFKIGSDAIRDDGQKITLSKQSSEESTIMALRMAQKRYGKKLTVTGSAELKERIVRAAAAARLQVIFTDQKMEEQRKTLTSAQKKQGMKGRGKAHGS